MTKDVSPKSSKIAANAPNPDFLNAWMTGRVVIIGRLAEGPDAGGEVICITPRMMLKRHISRIRNGELWRDVQFLDSVRGAVRTQVMRGIKQMSSPNDSNFMADLSILMVIKAAGAGESALDGSGMFSLLLVVDEDATKPWGQRGFLSASDARGPVMDNMGGVHAGGYSS